MTYGESVNLPSRDHTAVGNKSPASRISSNLANSTGNLLYINVSYSRDKK